MINLVRRWRIRWRQWTGTEPVIRVTAIRDLEFHGNDYCGWAIPRGSLSASSVVVDIGVGEDISFSTSLIRKFGLVVHGFDPTPRAIAYVASLAPPNFRLHEYAVGAQRGSATFYLPNNQDHVSGSLIPEGHVGTTALAVELLTVGDLFARLGCEKIDLLKMDIEGAEYGVLASEEFAAFSDRISMLCIEFHHRWPSLGKQATLDAVETLTRLGFSCAWQATTSNEEFLFVRDR